MKWKSYKIEFNLNVFTTVSDFGWMVVSSDAYTKTRLAVILPPLLFWDGLNAEKTSFTTLWYVRLFSSTASFTFSETGLYLRPALYIYAIPPLCLYCMVYFIHTLVQSWSTLACNTFKLKAPLYFGWTLSLNLLTEVLLWNICNVNVDCLDGFFIVDTFFYLFGFSLVVP